MIEIFLSQKDLARRWGISHRTLERWRWLGTGPLFLKVGARVAYRLRDVEAYEATRLRSGGSKAISASQVDAVSGQTSPGAIR